MLKEPRFGGAFFMGVLGKCEQLALLGDETQKSVVWCRKNIKSKHCCMQTASYPNLLLMSA